MRPFRPGDRVRSLNWRASARRGEPWVTEHLLERNADVVLFLDTFAELGVAPTTTLDLTIRAATALGRGYLGERDRVGLVVFGGYLRWLLPRMGTRQAHRLAAALIDAEVAHSDAWKDVDVLPRRTLPSGCLVVALTPLLDRRTVGALADLRARGFDVAVIDTLPAALGHRPAARTDPAERMLDLRRAAIRGPVPAPRARPRHVGARRPPRGRPRPGPRLPPPRAPHRMTWGAVRVLPLAGLAGAWATATVLVTRGDGETAGISALLAVLAGVALAGGTRWRWPAATTAGVLLLLTAYSLGLALRDTVDDRAPMLSAALVAAVLCASWASEPPAARAPRSTPGAGEDPGRLRGLAVVTATLASLGLATLVLEVSAAGGTRSLWLQVAGAAAALGTVVALVALSRRGPAPARAAEPTTVAGLVAPAARRSRRRRSP